MNGIEKIADLITRDARQEIESILAKANEDAAAVTAKYQQEADAAVRKIQTAGEEQAKEIQRRAKSAAELEARQAFLATKQAMITKAFSLALERLLALPQPEYIALLSRLAAEASASGTEQVILSAKDHAACGAQVTDQANALLAQKGKPAALTLSAETRPIIGGLLLKAGDVEVNCSLDTIVRLSKDSLALDVAAALFA